jgi:hypothetical protein
MKRTFLTLAIASSMAVSLPAFANKGADYKGSSHHSTSWANGWYVGGGINGNAPTTQNQSINFDFFDFSSEIELEDSDIGFDVYVGKQISKRWAAELGFTQVGDITFTNDIYLYDGDNTFDFVEAYEVKQWNVHLVGLYKLNVGDHFNVFGKFGAAYFNSTEEFSITANYVPDGFPTGDLIENNLGTFALTYGFGAEVVWDNWGIRGEYNVISPAEDIVEGNFYTDEFYIADIVSANIYYRFN